jgi:hypothetical protein
LDVKPTLWETFRIPRPSSSLQRLTAPTAGCASHTNLSLPCNRPPRAYNVPLEPTAQRPGTLAALSVALIPRGQEPPSIGMFAAHRPLARRLH